MKTTKTLLFAAIFALMPLLLFAQIDEKSMQGDITILEDVLNDLLSPPGSPQQFSCRGLYLDGYGVIFHVSHSGADHFPFIKDFKVDMKLARESQFKAQQELAAALKDQARQKAEQEKITRELEKSEEVLAQVNEEMARVEEELAKANEEMARQNAGMAAAEELQRKFRGKRGLAELYEDRPDSLSVKKAAELVAGIKNNLTLFFADYARGLSQLPASERITILVNFEDSPVLTGWYEKDEKTELQDFSVSLTKSELPALRQGRNPESTLRFQDAKTNAAVARELEIFTGILSKSVGGPAEKAPWSGSGARSMVVPGYGTIILLSSSSFDLANLEALKEYAAQAAAQAEKKPGLSTGFASPEESWKKKLPVLKEQIIEQLARYGGSLRSLKADENIMIVLSSRHGFWGQERTPGISIAARMSDVNKVFNDEMSLQLFKNKLTIREY